MNHKCKTKQFNLIIAEEDIQGMGDDEGELRQNGDELEVEGEISLHALMGNMAKTTIKVLDFLKKRALTILIDSGSTHSFLDSETARNLSCLLVGTTPWVVTVADGSETINRAKYPKFAWKMNGYWFEVELRVIPLGGCDVILGTDWMWSYSLVTFDYKERKVMLHHMGRKITLKGVKDYSEAQSSVEYKGLKNFLKKNIISSIVYYHS